eukprot:124935-Chlamydomonas_euryale.AAC.1
MKELPDWIDAAFPLASTDTSACPSPASVPSRSATRIGHARTISPHVTSELRTSEVFQASSPHSKLCQNVAPLPIAMTACHLHAPSMSHITANAIILQRHMPQLYESPSRSMSQNEQEVDIVRNAVRDGQSKLPNYA